jgi:hypothetical protein
MQVTIPRWLPLCLLIGFILGLLTAAWVMRHALGSISDPRVGGVLAIFIFDLVLLGLAAYSARKIYVKEYHVTEDGGFVGLEIATLLGAFGTSIYLFTLVSTWFWK